MEIDALEAVRVGDSTQWIRIRGTTVSNPVLLLMQQGPGLPIINEARTFHSRLRLEEDFTVVYWDQRGTGLSSPSLRRTSDDIGVSAVQMVDDTVELLQLLGERFGAKAFVAGFSFGATFAAQAAARRPDLVAALVATGMDIDIPFAEKHTYEFVLRAARQQRNGRAVRQLEGIGPPPHLDAKRFSARARWAANFGGVTADSDFNGLMRVLLVSLLRSPDYSPADIVRTIRGITSTQNALLPQLADTDLITSLPHLQVPIVIAQGLLDQVAPALPAQRFFYSLTAPDKQLVWFEKSAHTPQYDEPDKFRDLLMAVRSSHLANT